MNAPFAHLSRCHFKLERLTCPLHSFLRYEKTVVEWVQDSLVKKCPDCGEGFGFTRRRHHCRLCGGVVCAPCSETIDVPEVRAFPLPLFSVKLVENSQGVSLSFDY